MGMLHARPLNTACRRTASRDNSCLRYHGPCPRRRCSAPSLWWCPPADDGEHADGGGLCDGCGLGAQLGSAALFSKADHLCAAVQMPATACHVVSFLSTNVLTAPTRCLQPRTCPRSLQPCTTFWKTCSVRLSTTVSFELTGHLSCGLTREQLQPLHASSRPLAFLAHVASSYCRLLCRADWGLRAIKVGCCFGRSGPAGCWDVDGGQNALCSSLLLPTRMPLPGAAPARSRCRWWRAACCARRRGRTSRTCCSARCGA